MNFKIERDHFFRVLQKVISVIPTKSTVEILYNVLIQAEDSRLSITATDLEITQIAWTDCTVLDAGQITVPGKILLDIIRELPNVEIEFHSDENNKIIIKSELGEYKLSGESKNEYPSSPQIESDNKIKISNDALKHMIEKTIFACSSDHFRPALTGVYCQFYENEYRMVATDGHRLVKLVNPAVNSTFNKDIIIPTKALNFTARNLKEGEEHQITISENHVLFELPDTHIYSRIIKESYPDYERVIPASFTKEMKINRNEFISSVKRVSLFSNPITSQVRLHLESNVLQIYAQDIEFGGEANEHIPCSFESEPLEIAYNANYLLDLLRHFDSDKIRMTFNDSDSPALIYPDEEENRDIDLVMLIMPVRINS